MTVFLSVNVFSQIQNSCSDPYVYNSIPGFTTPMPTTGNAQVGPNYGCLATQPNPLWLLIPICSAGDLTIEMSNTGGSDLDFNVWGPFTGMSAPTICNNLWGSGIDCSYSVSGNDTINIPPSVSGDYYMVLITNFGGSVTDVVLNTVGGTAVSDTSCYAFGLSCTPESLPICEITVNDSANHCKILWEKPTTVAVDKYYIQRLNSMSVYELIDSIPDSDSSYYIDYTSWPSTQPYRYKIYYEDSCGNQSISSGLHQSIHLQASPGFNSVNLDWDEYIGLFFPTYYVLRGTDPFNMNIIDSIASAFTSYTDYNSTPGEPCYQVGFTNPDPCMVTRSNEILVYSNVFNTGINGVDELTDPTFSVSPNPAEDKIRIAAGSHQNIDAFEIHDLTGRLILSQNNLNRNYTEANVSFIAAGTYLLLVKTQGKYAVQKLIIR